MYDFVFYFFYGFFRRRNDGESAFTSILFTFIVVALHLIALAKILAYFNFIGGIPRFSSKYLYNKLYWYLPAGALLAIVYIYFGKEKTKRIIKKYSEIENFYSIGRILLFLLLVILPALIIGNLKTP